MRYVVQSSKYVFKNFFYIFPFAVIPALFLSFSTDQTAIKSVLDLFFGGALSAWDFNTLFRAVSVLNFGSWKSVGFGLVGVASIIVGVAMMMALLEKHMRFGKRTFNGIVSKLNDNLISTSWYGFLIVLIYEFWSLITAALLFLMSRIGVVWLAYICVGAVMIGMHFVLLYTINLIYLWLPCMQITGFKGAEALQYSNHLSSPVKWRIIFAQTLSLFAVETILFLCVLFTANVLTFIVITAILYAFLIMIYCVRMEIVYFDLDNLERKDLCKYYQR